MKETKATTPPLLKNLREAKAHILNVNERHRESLTKLERLAVWITDHVGTMGFFLIIFVWPIIWLGRNTFFPLAHRFDPFSPFVLFLFFSNIISIFLYPLSMILQNYHTPPS